MQLISRAGGGLFQLFQLFQLFFIEGGKDAENGVKMAGQVLVDID